MLQCGQKSVESLWPMEQDQQAIGTAESITLNISDPCDLPKKRILKGTGFSPSVNKKSQLAAQAAEGMQGPAKTPQTG